MQVLNEEGKNDNVLLVKSRLLSSKKVIVFDLDDTLTHSKTCLNEDMSLLLCKLMGMKIIAVMGGGSFKQFDKQFIRYLGCKEKFKNLFMFPTSGGEMYKYINSRWVRVYQNMFTKEEKKKIYDSFEKSFSDINYTKPAESYGDTLEDREDQITFSALGQNAPLEKKDKWNKLHNKIRFKLRSALKKYLPEFEVRLGGLTSIDVTKKGIDKAYGVMQLSKYLGLSVNSIVYVGDAIYEGGNDFSVVKTGVDTVKTSGVTETKRIINAAVKIITSTKKE